jgi:D-xylose 1-dehydrogenase (NADP+, D-xylono-1,5-lactone-forming)
MDEQGRIGWGVLGAAGVASRRFLPALRAADGARLVAVGSRSLQRAVAAVEAAGQGRAVGAYAAVLDDPEVEAVYLPLPNALHHEWALRSLAAGKHVLCEKPLALSVAAVDELSRAAAAAGRMVMEGFMYRLHPQYEEATWRPLLAELGPLHAAHVRYSFPFNRPGDIRENAALGGGALWDIGCYCLDSLGWQLGEVLDIQALGDMRGDCQWTASVQMRFASSVLATAWWSFAGPLSQRLTLIGERGTLDLGSPFRASGPAAARLEVNGEARRVELPTDDCFRREIEHFGEVIRGETPPAVPLAESARWIRVAEEVDRQVREAVADRLSRTAIGQTTA